MHCYKETELFSNAKTEGNACENELKNHNLQ